MHLVGLHGQPRRYADFTPFLYLNTPGIHGLNEFMTYCAFGLGLTQIIIAYNFFHSLALGPKAPANPWHSNTLEWVAPSPPPHYNFETIPTVYHPAYEYSVPGVSEDFLPQTQPLPPNAPPLDPVMA
jgi:cytochrome c oxidase subunit 1